MAVPVTMLRTVLLLLAAGGVGALAAAYFMPDRNSPVTEMPAPPRVAAMPAPTPPPSPVGLASTPPAPVAPSFDVVRVGPHGDTVIAGRAAPGAEVVIRDGQTEVARAQADQRGEFVALPTAPLPPGGSALRLAARGADGAEVAGNSSVVVIVPQPAAPEPPVALLRPDAGPPVVLQGGARGASGGNTVSLPGDNAVSLDVVDYDTAGTIRFTGTAKPGGTVRVYIDTVAAGDAPVDATGQWTLVPTLPVDAGVHTLRVDGLDAAGMVIGRAESPFQRATLAAAGPDLPGRVVVQPGQSLWRLAQAAYGRGVQYSVIYLANRGQIRDPAMIYPGQVFAVPAN